MKENKAKYTKGPIKQQGKIVRDFLPSPEELGFNQQTTKITIALSDFSLNFFKSQAKKYNTQYQKMIRDLLDQYASQHR